MTKGIAWLVAGLLTPVGLSVGAFQQPKASAVLTGTVLFGDGTPVDRATVAILGTDRPGVRTTVTDAAGEFSFDGLAAGSFTVWCAKDGSLTSYYGSKHPGRGPAMPVSLASGQRVTVSMTMLRGASIAGTITDPSGRPMSRVSVRVRPVSSSETAEPQTSKTDGDGRYLIFGLAPGEYLVEALPPPAEGSVAVYAPTFFPSVAVIDEASTIAVTAGEQRDDVTFSLYRAARVSGKVVVPNGQAMSGVSLALIPTEPAARPAQGAGSRLTADVARVTATEIGEFSIPGVIPGTYALWARWDSNSAARAAGPDASTLWGAHTVVVKGPDVFGVVLNLQPGARVSGTIRIDINTNISAASRTPAMEALRLTLSPQASSAAAFAGRFVATPDPTGDFVFPSVPPGLYDLRIAPGEIPGSPLDTWVMASAIVSGQDAADSPLDIRPGAAISGVVVTLTETEISGTVLDDAGQPTARFPLLFFAVDRTLWTHGSRRVRTVQPAADGTFRAAGLPPGEYFVVAYPNIDTATGTGVDVAVEAPVDAVHLDQFAGVAGRITIASGEKRSLQLTLGSPPDSGVGPGGPKDFSGTWTTFRAAGEGLSNSPAGQLRVGGGSGRLGISQRGDRLRIQSHYLYTPAGPAGTRNTVEYGLNGEPVRNPFFLGPPPPDTAPSEVTSWWQGDKLVSTVDVFLPGESVPRHYVETISISPKGILAVRIERVGFPDTRTMFYRKAR
jgi:hypothetical protein